jgi:hypothetical protein
MKNIIAIILILTGGILNAQNGKGKQFVALDGETFSGKAISIPKDTKGKISLIGICFSKKAEEDLKTWLNPVYNLLIVKKDTNDFFSAAVNYDVPFYFVPMLNKVNQLLEKSSKEKIKEGTDKEFWPHLVFYSGETKNFKETFDIQDKDIPYFFVLDKSGKVLHVESGKYNDKKMDKIEELFD